MSRYESMGLLWVHTKPRRRVRVITKSYRRASDGQKRYVHEFTDHSAWFGTVFTPAKKLGASKLAQLAVESHEKGAPVHYNPRKHGYAKDKRSTNSPNGVQSEGMAPEKCRETGDTVQGLRSDARSEIQR